MTSRERIKYAESMIEFGISADDYMRLIKGNDIEQIEDRIRCLQEYLLYKKLNLVCDYSGDGVEN